MTTVPAGGEELPIGKAPVATYALIAINTIVFFLLTTFPGVVGASSYEQIVYTYGNYPYDILCPSTFYRLFTSMFLHADLLHLFGNMLFLYVFGRGVERVLGSGRFLVLYFVSGIIASVFNTLSVIFLPASALLSKTQALIYPWLVPAIGASGAISGILGAYFLLYPRAQLVVFFYFIPVTMPAYVYISFWFLFQLLMGIFAASISGIAFWAHIGGFIAGIALLRYLVDEKRLAAIKLFARVYYNLF